MMSKKDMICGSDDKQDSCSGLRGVFIETIYVEFFKDKFSRDVENRSSIIDPSNTRENVIDEPRRSTRDRNEDSLGDDFYSYLVEGTQTKVSRDVIFTINLDDDPKTLTEFIPYRDAPLWTKAMNDEMESVIGNRIW
uniref:Uncharacterized protein n=1 Tax=Lactuca sativa TaxID=4236 RepID=A0A9R1XTH4_LACSA|nr:hypothetical protein LSAT_V11C300108370 [Lactuca sativa]